MLTQLLPLYLALPVLSLTAGAFAVHFTMKLRAATLKTPRVDQSHRLIIERAASARMTTPV